MSFLFARLLPFRARRFTKAQRPRFHPRLERLEDLTLPSTLDVTLGSLTYTASAAVKNNLTISVNNGNYTVNDTGEPITLTTTAGVAGWTQVDANTVTGPTSSVTVNFTVNLQDGTDALTVNGPISVNGNVALQSGQNITLNAGAQITTPSPGTIALAGGPNAVITLNQGQLNAPAGATITGQGNNDTFNITLPVTVPAGTTPLTITGGGPTAPVTVVSAFPNQASTLPNTGSVLNLNDQGSPSPNTYTLTGTTFQRVAPSGIPTGLITYGTLSTLVFNTGTGTDTVNVTSTLAQGNTTVNGNGLTNTFNITTTGSSSNNVFNALAGTSTFTLNGTGSGSFDQLNATANDNTFNVLATAATSLTEVNGGTGNDTTNLGNPTTKVLDGIQGSVNVNGHAAVVPGGFVPIVRSLPQFVLPGLSVLGNVINLLDQGSTANNIYTVGPASLARSNVGAITYANLESITVNTGTGNNTIVVTGTASFANTTVNAAASHSNNFTILTTGVVGNSKFIGGNGNDLFTLDGTGVNSFTEIDGGSGSNTYDVNGTSDLTEVNGGSGSNDFRVGTGTDTLDRIQGGLDFTGGGGSAPIPVLTTFPGVPLHITLRAPFNSLDLLDDSTTRASSYAIASNVVQRGGAPIFYSGLTDLQLLGGKGSSIYNVITTGNAMNTTVDAVSGNNTFLIQNTGTGNNVFYAGTGSDVFRVFTTGPGSFNQFNGTAGNAFYANATGLNSLTEINSGPNALFVALGIDQGAPYGTLGNFLGIVLVNGNLNAPQGDLLQLHDEINTANTTYSLENLALRHSINHPAPGSPPLMPVAFTNIQNLSANFGAGINLVNVLGTRTGQTSVLTGGGGSEFYDVISTGGPTTLNGGAAPSVFKFEDGATLSGGSVHGITSADNFDLANYTSTTRVDLQAGVAMNLSTGAPIASVSGINAVQGGNGGSTILGGTGNFVLVGGTGNDTITGGSGGVNILYANDHLGSVDVLNGGNGLNYFLFNSAADFTNGALTVNLGPMNGQLFLASVFPSLIAPPTYQG